MKTKILNTLLLLTSLSLLTACGNGIGGTGIEPVNADIQQPAANTIAPATIPFREHGYSNFETTVFHSQTELDSFINDVNGQADWNQKVLFLQQLQAVAIDFSANNLVIYRITESSGSNVLMAESPTLVNDKLTVVIDRQVSEVGTADMAYYALAYTVDKSITEMIFDNGSSQITVDLSDSTTATAQGKLVRSSAESLLAYFQGSIKRNYTKQTGGEGQPEPVFSEAAPSADATPSAVPSADAGSGGDTSVSSTNLQELGVDEADLIKTNGRYIYSVKKATSFTVTTDIAVGLPVEESAIYPGYSTSSDSIRIMDTQSATGLSEVKTLSDDDTPWNITGLYLHESQDQLIALSSAKQNYYTNWFNSYYFANQNTDVMFFDVAEPNTASVTTKLSFEGQLIDSRRNGDTLYMVLRNYPNYQYESDAGLATTTNDDFLPSYTIGDLPSQPITPSEDCFVEEGQQGSADIITLVAVDLSATTPQINSQCYVGSAEAIYASQNALYLATTRWDYQFSDDIAVYDNQVTTDIHKFAYDGLSFDYRGSGEVDGHLGFRQSSKSFRFSESGDFLRVVTLDEDQWNFLPIAVEAITEEPNADNVSSQSATEATYKSPVLLSILKDNPTTKSLELVSKLPNTNRPAPIGLPGEQLYASRYIGNRGYLITFRVTDPLYVLDLSDPTDPLIAGELKIDGYSEYLHPISENLLLGIGKDAVPSGSDNTGNEGRGAWYQGVKLSLLDVTDPANPREADKIILGKRGTESAALSNHHAVTGLKVNDNYRVAIPVRLHTETTQASSSASPWAYYGYTHTGLYRFDIDIGGQTIEQVPALVVDTSANQGYQDIYNDRSVIVNDDVFYMHDGSFWMQDWLGNNAVIGPK